MMRPMVDQMMGGSTGPSSTPPTTGYQNTQPAANTNAFGGGGGGGGFGDFGGMGGGGFGDNGGNQDLGAMMNDPNMQNMMNNPMMQNLMNDPNAMNQMMNDPMVQNMMQQRGVDMGQMQSMINNMGGLGNVMNMAQQMQGSGGGGGGGTGAFGGTGGGGFGNNGGNTAYNNNYRNTSSPQQAIPPKTFVDLKTIFRYNKSSVSQVVAKLNTFLKEDSVVVDLEQVKNLERFLTTETKNVSLVSQDALTALSKMVQNLSEAKVFPALDLLRMILLTPSISQRVINQEATFQIFSTLESRFLQKWQTCSMPTQLMVLRCFCNIFPEAYSSTDSNPTAVEFLLSKSGLFSKLLDIIAASLTCKLEAVRLTGASFASNVSLYLSKNSNDDETQLLFSMVEYCSSESSNDVLYKMLLTVYRLLNDNATAKSLLAELGHDFGTVLSKSTVEDTKLLTREIISLISGK